MFEISSRKIDANRFHNGARLQNISNVITEMIILQQETNNSTE